MHENLTYCNFNLFLATQSFLLPLFQQPTFNHFENYRIVYRFGGMLNQTAYSLWETKCFLDTVPSKLFSPPWDSQSEDIFSQTLDNDPEKRVNSIFPYKDALGTELLLLYCSSHSPGKPQLHLISKSHISVLALTFRVFNYLAVTSILLR
jgi:hypothetical protein